LACETVVSAVFHAAAVPYGADAAMAMLTELTGSAGAPADDWVSDVVSAAILCDVLLPYHQTAGHCAVSRA
jgi:hypothetical protein